MTAQIKQMPPAHVGYAQARVILRNHRRHDLDAIDAAFEVLVYSRDESDKALCRIVEDEMWLVPSPGAGVIVITMIAVALTCVGVATLVGRLVL
jgi:glycogen synthase